MITTGHTFTPLLGQALVAFLWQGALGAAALTMVLRASRSPRVRHDAALVILVLMAACPPVTLAWLHSHRTLTYAVLPAFAGLRPSGWQAPVVALWLVGVALLAIRTLGGLWLISRLRNSALPLTTAWSARCRDLARRMAVRMPVAFASSGRIDSPISAGWLKPLVLIPAAALIHLSAGELEALILHELAHLRRLDAFTNLLQTVVETLLFYHPAVWWVSHRIRIEREHCCDDMVISAGRDPAVYARALQAMEVLRPAPALALAANGGALKARIARLLGMALAPEESPPARTVVATVVLAFGAMVLAASFQPAAPLAHAPASAALIARQAVQAAPAHQVSRLHHRFHSAPASMLAQVQPAAAGPSAEAPTRSDDLDARLDQLAQLMAQGRGLSPEALFVRGRQINALRSQIIALEDTAGV